MPAGAAASRSGTKVRLPLTRYAYLSSAGGGIASRWLTQPGFAIPERDVPHARFLHNPAQSAWASDQCQIARRMGPYPRSALEVWFRSNRASFLGRHRCPGDLKPGLSAIAAGPAGPSTATTMVGEPQPWSRSSRVCVRQAGIRCREMKSCSTSHRLISCSRNTLSSPSK